MANIPIFYHVLPWKSVKNWLSTTESQTSTDSTEAPGMWRDIQRDMLDWDTMGVSTN